LLVSSADVLPAMPIDVSRFHDDFLAEVAEHIEAVERFVLAAREDPDDVEMLDALFRAAHSIKGAAATFGFREMAEFTHGFEGLLDAVRRRRAVLDEEVVSLVLEARDALGQILAAYRQGDQPEMERYEDLRARLETCGRKDDAPNNPGRLYRIRFQPSVTEEQAATDMRGALEAALSAVGEEVRREDDDGDYWGYEVRSNRSIDDLRKMIALVAADGSEVEIHPVAAGEGVTYGFFDEPTPARKRIRIATEKAEETDATIRVRVEKVDALVDLVGEMLIAQSALDEIVRDLDAVTFSHLHGAVDQLRRHTRDLREAVMSVRMLPIAGILARFPRMVHELSRVLGKEVRLEVRGGETELDRGLLEMLVDPLIHLVRNAIDHGIEPPADRVRVGKSAAGTVMIRSYQQGGRVYIDVSDDGRGLDRARILAKATELGLGIDPEASDEDVWQVIFVPGFSTAGEVTGVSGRGVGMDVVKQNIVRLGGNVTVRSKPGEGTTVQIGLPLTLAILDGLTVRVGGELFVIPLRFIVESLALDRRALITVAGDASIIAYRDSVLPVIDLREYVVDPTPPLPQAIAVIVESDGHRVALLVDELEGEHQIVVKSLESNFRRVEGFAGATIMGNGNVVLIVDIAGIIAGRFGGRETADMR